MMSDEETERRSMSPTEEGVPSTPKCSTPSTEVTTALTPEGGASVCFDVGTGEDVGSANVGKPSRDGDEGVDNGQSGMDGSCIRSSLCNEKITPPTIEEHNDQFREDGSSTNANCEAEENVPYINKYVVSPRKSKPSSISSLRSASSTIRSYSYGSPRRSPIDSDRERNVVAAGWGVHTDEETGNTVVEQWDPKLPRRPSLTLEDERYNPKAPTICIFNANTKEGSTMVRVLSEKRMNVVAVVRVFTSSITKQLLKLRYVTVKVADYNDLSSLVQVAEGCNKAIIITKFWEKFESAMEEQVAMNVLEAIKEVGIQEVVLGSFEDTMELRRKNEQSQLAPIASSNGKIRPKFKGMKPIRKQAKQLKLHLTHMMTSYLDNDEEQTKKSLVLIKPPHGKIIVQSHGI